MSASLRPSVESLQECMKSTNSIRNVCILAHVDHGKTTIADSLLATNRLVSKRLAGSIRFLDDRLDEQERGITMKSSTVSLFNEIHENGPSSRQIPLLLNLIDTPGHIDFSSEVVAALRVCDGALIVVDLVEGVCVQTREAIKQAFTERCKMVLLLNKIDRLVVELHKDITEIFQAILHAIENCNAIIAELYQYEYCDNDVDIEDTGLLFSPEMGNVIFASAIDGWGCTLKQFAALFINVIKDETLESLNTKLWNFDAYIDSKTNTVKLGATEKNKTNLFVQLCLKTLCHIYATIVVQMQKDKVVSIAEKLKINVTRDMNHNDPKIQLRALMQSWSPVADVILKQCHQIINPPSEIPLEKIKILLDYNRLCEEETYRNCLDNLVTVLQSCSCSDPVCIAYVSKMFCVDKRNLSQNKPKVFVPKPRGERAAPKPEEPSEEPKIVEAPPKEEEDSKDYSIIALARVFSGTLRTGQDIYMLTPQFTPNSPKDAYLLVKIKELYMLFGRELVLVDEVTCGNVCGIGGLDYAIIRTATLSSTLNCVPFVELPSTPPIVRNAIEPVNPKDLPVLGQGLRTLLQSDSCVQVLIQETGEYVLVTAGDVHLAKCLEDLTSKFAKIELNVSSPMVSLRETVTVGKKESDCELDITTSQMHVRVVVKALPHLLAEEIEKNYKILRTVEELQQIPGFELFVKRDRKTEELHLPKTKTFKSESTNTSLKHIKDQIDTHLKQWTKQDYKIWSVGTMNNSINLLINATEDYKRSIFETLDETDARSCFDHFIVNAFNVLCKAGPICEEPLQNCAVVIKQFRLLQDDILDGTTKSNVNIQLQLSASFREAFEKQQMRLMEPMFTTSIQVNTNILGKVYSVVNRRHGKVLDAVGMDEQEKSFLVKAQIPVIESTGFANEMRKTTSGQAIPTLKFSHFEIIDGDPYYEPQEDEEDEDVNVESAIRATKLRKEIRKRKGLHVEEQVVVNAEKQRTLSKKK